jgi:hypothetical protein
MNTGLHTLMGRDEWRRTLARERRAAKRPTNALNKEAAPKSGFDHPLAELVTIRS